MDAYELPEEFAHLQAQDMSKIGFINDIIRGIKKVIVKESGNSAATKSDAVQQSIGSTTASVQIKRGNNVSRWIEEQRYKWWIVNYRE